MMQGCSQLLAATKGTYDSVRLSARHNSSAPASESESEQRSMHQQQVSAALSQCKVTAATCQRGAMTIKSRAGIT